MSEQPQQQVQLDVQKVIQRFKMMLSDKDENIAMLSVQLETMAEALSEYQKTTEDTLMRLRAALADAGVEDPTAGAQSAPGSPPGPQQATGELVQLPAPVELSVPGDPSEPVVEVSPIKRVSPPPNRAQRRQGSKKK